MTTGKRSISARPRASRARAPGARRPRALGRRRRRVVLAARARRARTSTTSGCAELRPGADHDVELPVRPDRPARALRRVRHDGRLARRLLPPHRLARPAAVRARSAPTATTRRPASRCARCSPPSTTAGAPARASTSTSPRPRRACTSSSPACSTTPSTAASGTRAGNADPHMAPHGVYPSAGDDALGRHRLPRRRRLAGAGRAHRPRRPRRPVDGRAAGPARRARRDRRRRGPRRARRTRPWRPLIAAGVPAHAVQNSGECCGRSAARATSGTSSRCPTPSTARSSSRAAGSALERHPGRRHRHPAVPRPGHRRDAHRRPRLRRRPPRRALRRRRPGLGVPPSSRRCRCSVTPSSPGRRHPFTGRVPCSTPSPQRAELPASFALSTRTGETHDPHAPSDPHRRSRRRRRPRRRRHDAQPRRRPRAAAPAPRHRAAVRPAGGRSPRCRTTRTASSPCPRASPTRSPAARARPTSRSARARRPTFHDGTGRRRRRPHAPHPDPEPRADAEHRRSSACPHVAGTVYDPGAVNAGGCTVLTTDGQRQPHRRVGRHLRHRPQLRRRRRRRGAPG